MSTNDLKTILERHRMWLKNEEEGERAHLREADLRGSNLREEEMEMLDEH